jgi:hypothetical protein
VLAALFVLRIALTSEVQPDILVARYDDLVSGRHLPGAAARWPALAVTEFRPLIIRRGAAAARQRPG